MADPDLLGLFATPLGRAGTRYMVSGSVAAMLYGEPRMTLDVDLIVELDDASIDTLQTSFRASTSISRLRT